MRAKEIKQTNNEALDIKMPKKNFNNVKKLRATENGEKGMDERLSILHRGSEFIPAVNLINTDNFAKLMTSHCTEIIETNFFTKLAH